MKNSPLITIAALLIAVASIVLHFVDLSSKKGSAEGSAIELPTNIEGGIVYLDIDSVLMNYKMYEDIMAELETKLSTKGAELQSKQRVFERNVADFQNKASKGLITRSEAAQMEQNLQIEQQSLMQEQQQAQYDLAEQEQVANRKVLNAIMEYLKGIEDESGYQFVLGNSFGGNIFYANSDLNITDSVIEGLNIAYAAEQE